MRFPEKPSRMTSTRFMECFGEIYEDSPWVADQAFATPLTAEHDTVAGIHKLMSRLVDESGEDVRLALLRAHPELAGRAAIAGKLTDASTSEQSQAGLDSCTPEEFSRFNDFNKRYGEKFGFPFIKAVKGANRHQILEAFETRLPNDPATEFATAVREVHKIALFRLQAIASAT